MTSASCSLHRPFAVETIEAPDGLTKVYLKDARGRRIASIKGRQNHRQMMAAVFASSFDMLDAMGPILSPQALQEVTDHVEACEAVGDKMLAVALRLLLNGHNKRAAILRGQKVGKL